MTTSILNDVKHVLGIGEDIHDFDQDLIMLINSQFATLHQLGVGPGVGFQITGATEQWSDFVDDVRLIATDAAVRQALREGAGRLAARFDSKAVIERLVELYRGLLR